MSRWLLFCLSCSSLGAEETNLRSSHGTSGQYEVVSADDFLNFEAENDKEAEMDNDQENSTSLYTLRPNTFLNNENISANAKTAGNISANWEEIGPVLDPVNRLNYIGRIDYIAFPDPFNKNNVFACSMLGGLFQSINGGDSWTNAGTDTNLPQCGVSCIAFDNINYNKICDDCFSDIVSLF